MREHGRPRSVSQGTVATGSPRGKDRAGGGVGEAHSSEEATNHRGVKGPWDKGNARKSESVEIDMSLETPQSVRKLQRALYVKAKANPEYRFYALYDKVWRKDVLRHAWMRCRENGGAAGVDAESFEWIESEGAEEWLDELMEELKSKKYKPQAVRRVYIPKADGGQRPLGIPTIRDRVVQMACVIVLEAIFEADLPEEQYAYRPQRSAHGAIRAAHRLLRAGYREVVDADLSGYFDTIAHHELMQSVARRVSDGAVLALIKEWLRMAVEEDNGKGGRRRSTEAKDNGRGTPQGAPISPLLANLYMRRFILAWKKQGWESKLVARIVNYADDFVILCRGNAQQARERMETIMSRLKLTVNAQKTRVCRVPDESFDFLGYTFGLCHSSKGGQSYLGTTPSKKRVKRLCREISMMVRATSKGKETGELVEALNAKLRGWANYFSLGPVSSAYRVVDAHAANRLHQWLRRKYQSRKRRGHGLSYEDIYQKLGLLRLEKQTANLPWAKA